MISKLHAPLAFASTQRLSRPSLSRAQFLRAQKKALEGWLRHAVPKVPAFANTPASLAELPVMDKAQLMADFAGYNTQGITAEEIRKTLTHGDQIGDFTVGASTGTSGNQGLFVISDAERFRWLGSILAKTMADLLWRRQRVAILLPRGTGLYDSANEFGRLKLRFFNLAQGPDAWRAELEAFAPTVMVAPPKVLRYMAEEAYSLRPIRMFSAAETLDELDRPVIEGAFGVPLGQIYMATEGLLGVTCRHGKLHLAEDSVHFDYEPVGDGLVTPLISSFRRETQILARYRMNDLLRLEEGPCSCRSPLQIVAEVVGRMDDCFYLEGPQGRQMVTPDVLRNAVVMADGRISDFRILQEGHDAVTLLLPKNLSGDVARAAKGGLSSFFVKRGLSAAITLKQAPFELDVSRKLRRVECCIPQTPVT